MKDIDFDELDRAVSSVLGQNVKTSDEKPTEHVENTNTPLDTSSVADDAVVNTNTEQSVASEASMPVAPKPAATPLAIKRRGKFMDVMHPSSDMKPAGGSSSRPALPRPVITPLLTEEAESSVEHIAEPTAELDETHSLIGAEPTPVSTDLSDAGLNADNDVLTDTPLDDQAVSVDEDKHESLPMAATASEDSTSSADTSEQPAASSDELPADDTSVTDEAVAEAPAGQPTPFLSDTQVEKRPLGAFGDAEQEMGNADDASQNQLTAADTQATPVMSLPRELQPDVVGVESVQENEAIETPTTGSSNPFAAKVAVAPEANDGRVEGHPLFDTSTYHEPIAAVHHGALPGWAKWLIGLIVCLAIGAGVGYFLFTTGL